MLDRLEELRRMADRNNISTDLPKVAIKRKDTLDFTEEREVEQPSEDIMQAFMVKVELVNKSLNLLGQCNKRIKELGNKRFDVALGEEEKKSSDEVATIFDTSEKAREEIKRTLDLMARDIDETVEKFENSGQEQPEVRSKKQILNTLRLKFKDILKEANQIQLDYQKNAQNKIKRQLKIVKPDLTEEQLEELSKDADTGKKLISDMIMGPHAQLTAAVSDIKQKYEDILRLEKNVMQVHKMFEDLALLVHEQVVMMENIEANVGTAVNYLNKGEVHLKKAKKWYQKARTVFREVTR
eukprot:TRINITY_DN4135_c0_g6_i1.p1 TRINITY_DN4135_c0_g6~~TRINITY_DN4135_c0_g6_i1.p1  ORF type:complete len:297 (+),score=123.12 TRINITY_DN4135_c0_g6_i1:135-1025(+)